MAKGAVTTNVIVDIRTTSGSLPTNTVLASTTFSSDLLSSSFAFFDVTFSTPPSVTAGTQYAIGITTSSTPISAGLSGGGGAYANGNYYLKSGASWVNQNGDAAFKTYVENGALPTISVNDVSVIEGNTVTYTPNAGFVGTNTFDYRVTDADGDMAIATVTITVTNAQLASVSNFVWLDTNGNGVQDAGESGIAGITVQILNGATNAVLATTTTNATGNYAFTGLAPGTYKIKVNLPAGYGFTLKDVGADTLDSDINPSGVNTGRTDAFTLTAGANDTTRDAGLVRTNNGNNNNTGNNGNSGNGNNGNSGNGNNGNGNGNTGNNPNNGNG